MTPTCPTQPDDAPMSGVDMKNWIEEAISEKLHNLTMLLTLLMSGVFVWIAIMCIVQRYYLAREMQPPRYALAFPGRLENWTQRMMVEEVELATVGSVANVIAV